MSHFTRTHIAPETVVPSELTTTEIEANPDYAPYLSIPVSVSEYEAPAAIAGIDKALGGRITQYLLAEDGEATLQVGAEVLREHALYGKSTSDLQTSLLVNIVKELAMNQEEQYGLQKVACDNILRRCTLAPEYKKHVMGEILKGDTLINPFIVSIEMN